tara:strand:+ start:2518 stop:3591 length:1074 start_codon:yes stop_codon:yes gene_type:complete
MKVYTKFITFTFLSSLLFVLVVTTSLVFILNLLSEIDFFKENNVQTFFILFLSILNSPSMIFEIFPFILLITTQLFFIKLFNNNEIEVFKYSGLKNSKILYIISVNTILIGIVVATIFYNLSSNLKNFYLELKSPYTSDGKYLAVITKNGLWIKDVIDEKILITNASKIEKNFLINSFVSEFDKNFNVIRNYKSEKIDIRSNNWLILNARIYEKNNYEKIQEIRLKTNFDYQKILSLYSNLSSLSLFELYELRKNYIKLNISITEVNLQMLKIISFPIFLLLVVIFSALIMFRVKQINGNTFKIAVGLFFSVIIYYLNNFFYVLGSTEKINLSTSILIPLIILIFINSIMMVKINEK